MLCSRLEKMKILKCSYGHLEFSFDKATENFLPDVQKFIAQNPKIFMKVLMSSKNFSEKVILEAAVFFQKKRFHAFKRHLQQNWWTENMRG